MSRLCFGILGHRADDLVVPDSGLQHRGGAVGGHSTLPSYPQPHKRSCLEGSPWERVSKGRAFAPGRRRGSELEIGERPTWRNPRLRLSAVTIAPLSGHGTRRLWLVPACSWPCAPVTFCNCTLRQCLSLSR